MADITFPWERFAMSNEPMPDGLPSEEQAAYQALAHLYGRYRLKLISREDGHTEKCKIQYEFDLRKRQAETDRKLAKHHADMLRKLEGAANAYAKNRTLENADRLYQAVYGAVPSGYGPGSDGKT